MEFGRHRARPLPNRPDAGVAASAATIRSAASRVLIVVRVRLFCRRSPAAGVGVVDLHHLLTGRLIAALWWLPRGLDCLALGCVRWRAPFAILLSVVNLVSGAHLGDQPTG